MGNDFQHKTSQKTKSRKKFEIFLKNSMVSGKSHNAENRTESYARKMLFLAKIEGGFDKN